MITVNEKCLHLIKSWEGFESKAYHGGADRVDVFTIGYGTIQYPPSYMGGKRVALTDPAISEAQAIDFLRHEVAQKAQQIDILLRDDLSGNQFAALISFAYNLGSGALRQSTLREKVNLNPADHSIRGEFMKWVIANGTRVKGLVNRRIAEADLYFTV